MLAASLWSFLHDCERDCPTQLHELLSVCAGRWGGGIKARPHPDIRSNIVRVEKEKRQRGLLRSSPARLSVVRTRIFHDGASVSLQRAARHVWLLDPPLWVKAAVVFLCRAWWPMASCGRRVGGRNIVCIAFKVKAKIVRGATNKDTKIKLCWTHCKHICNCKIIFIRLQQCAQSMWSARKDRLCGWNSKCVTGFYFESSDRK